MPAAVDDALKILNQTIGPKIHPLTRAEPGLRPAWVDPNQLELAILNLALNARASSHRGVAYPTGIGVQRPCDPAGCRSTTERASDRSLRLVLSSLERGGMNIGPAGGRICYIPESAHGERPNHAAPNRVLASGQRVPRSIKVESARLGPKLSKARLPASPRGCCSSHRHKWSRR